MTLKYDVLLLDLLNSIFFPTPYDTVDWFCI